MLRMDKAYFLHQVVLWFVLGCSMGKKHLYDDVQGHQLFDLIDDPPAEWTQKMQSFY